jgi:hypothetical protein
MAYKQSAGGPRQSKTGGSLPGQLHNAGGPKQATSPPSFDDQMKALGGKIDASDKKRGKAALAKKQGRVIDSMKTVLSNGRHKAAEIFGDKDRGGKGLTVSNQGDWDRRDTMDEKNAQNKKDLKAGIVKY